MASVYIMTEPPTDIDYSSIDGRVRSFTLEGVCLYDESLGVQEEGWREKLIAFVHEQGLDIDEDGLGLHAFVYQLQDSAS